MVLCSVFAALIAICAWIAVPLPPISFTLQTFAVFLTLGLLGGKWGMRSIGLYLLLGVVGLPVFTGFRGGLSALLGPTGGFLWGFLATAVCYRVLERFGKLPAMILGQLVCYLCGSLWFTVYAPGTLFGAAVLTCVVPYLIPDMVKIWLAMELSKRIGRQFKIPSHS